MQPDKNFKEVAPFAPFVTERKGAVENSINLYKKFDYTD